MTTPTVHILFVGHALCGFCDYALPGEWPPGHRWTRIEDAAREATCERCMAAAAERTGVPASAGTGGPTIDGEFEEAAPGIPPEIIAVRGMFANEGAALLRALFAWRAQGSVTRWRTRPSRALATLADRLAREYPDATRALREQGERDAVDAALGRIHSLSTAEGRTRELARVGRELASLAEDVDAIGNHESEAADDERERTLDLAQPRPYAKTVEALRRFVQSWTEASRAEGLSERSPKAPMLDLGLLEEVADAFEAEDLAE